MELIVQIALLLVLGRVLRVGWSGPLFERSLTGDSRSEVFWLAALAGIAVSSFRYGWPSNPAWSVPGMISLLLASMLASAYDMAYRWTPELSLRARRAMELACGLPDARRMIRCWIWTTLALILGEQSHDRTSIVALLLAFVTAVVWMSKGWHLFHLALRTHKCGRTPWDDSPKGGFDLFLSYRRIHANTVRRVAEELMLRNVRVWFDEYMIRTRDRGFVSQRLEEGISASNNMAIFVNDSYAGSNWCCKSELEPYLEKYGAERIIPIGMPKEPVFTSEYGKRLEGCKWREVPSPNLGEVQVQEIVAHITNALGIDSVTKWPPDVIQEGGKRVEVMAEGCSVSLELPGFAWSHAEPNKTTGASGFYRLMKCVTFVFTEFSSGYERGLLRAAVPAEHQLDDTALMEQTRDFASGYLEECGYRDIGVHTVVAQGYRHFAISYWNTNVGAWSRKYSITIPHPATGKNFETVVTFTHFGSFIDFLRSTPLMGHVVATLKVEVKNGAS
jgi:hypothetical protein